MKMKLAIALAMTTLLAAPASASTISRFSYYGVFGGNGRLSGSYTGTLSGTLGSSGNNLLTINNINGTLSFSSLETFFTYNPVTKILMAGGGDASSAGGGYFSLKATDIVAAGPELTMDDLIGKTAAITYQSFQFSTTVSGTATFGTRPTAPITPGVPEPASWALMIGGIGLAGGMMRRTRTRTVTYA